MQLLDIRELGLPTLSNSTSSSSLSSIETKPLDNYSPQTASFRNNEGFYINDNSSLVTLMGHIHSSSSSTINLMNKTEDDFRPESPCSQNLSKRPSYLHNISSESAEPFSGYFTLPMLRSPSPDFSSYNLQHSISAVESPPLSASTLPPSLFNDVLTPSLKPPAELDSSISVPSTASTLERPCLPKKLKSSLKLPGLKRSNSLPQGVGNSGTKQVRFSNNLARVKTFTILSKPSSICSDQHEPVFLAKDSSSAMFDCYSSDTEEETSSEDETFFRLKASSSPKRQSSDWKVQTRKDGGNGKPYLKLHNFKTPNMLRSTDKIKLIELKIDSINSFELFGVIHVENVSFEKKVEIKYSVDNWKSNFINFANYHRSIDNKVDEFQFKINFKNLIKSKDYNDNNLLQICLIYCVNNETYYDNNFNENYQLTITKPSSSYVSTPSTSSNNIKTSTHSQTSNCKHERLSSSTIRSNFTGDFSHKYYFPSSFSSSSSSSSSSATSVASTSSNSSLTTMDMNFGEEIISDPVHFPNDDKLRGDEDLSTPLASPVGNNNNVSPSIASPQKYNTAAYNEFLSKYCYSIS